VKPVVLVTDAARAKVLELLAEEDDGTPMGLRIEITGENGPEYRYDLSFDAVSAAEPGDSVVDWAGLTVIVPADSIEKLQGAQLDLPAFRELLASAAGDPFERLARRLEA